MTRNIMSRTPNKILEDMIYQIRRYFDCVQEERKEDAECIMDDIKELARELLGGGEGGGERR